jgi:hypothetical protein
MAVKRRSRRKPAAVPKTKYVLVRGSRRNPNVMAAAPRKTRLTKLAKFLKSHFPGSRVRVEKVKLGR